MSTSCVWMPSAPNGKPSKLFQELQAKTGSRELAKEVWAFTKTKLFNSEFTDLAKDENGDYTYDSVASVLDLESLFSNDEKDISLAMDMGILNRSMEPVEFDFAQTALDKAADFNKKATGRVAVVQETEGGKFQVSVVENNAMNVAEADRDKVRSALNKRLISFIQKLGLNVEFMNDPSFQSVFNPKNAEENARLVSDIIQVSRGERGLEDLPEETAHLVIAGLKGQSLMERADNVFTPEVVKRVLGNSYQRYYDAYKDGKMPIDERMREEAQAKVLADIIKNRATEGFKETGPVRSIIRKVVDLFFRLFKKADRNELDNALVDARNAMGNIYDEMQRDDFDTVLDRELILKHEKMYDLVDRTDKLYEKAQEGETLLSKRLSILESTNNKAATEDLRKQIRAIRRNISNEQYEIACYSTLRSIGHDIKGLMKESERMGHIYNTSTDLNVIAAESSLVYRMSTSVQGYIPYLETLLNLPHLIKKGEIDMDAQWVDPIVSTARQYLEQITTLKDEVSSMRFSVLKQLINLHLGNNGEMPFTFTETDRIKWESADMILRKANEDVRWWDTHIFSAGDSKNRLINVIHNIVVSQQAKRNNIINKHVMKLQDATARLHAAGYDNKFVYQMDENGVPTGYYEAPVNMAKFYEDLHAYEDLVNENDDMDDFEKAAAIEKWKDDHMEEVEIIYGDPIDNKGTRRTEWMPKAYNADGSVMYANKDFQKGWDQAQKDYYAALLDMKANMDAMLPPAVQAELYHAPQCFKSVTQMFDKDGQGAVKTVWRKWKKIFSVTRDNAEYGYAEDPDSDDIQVDEQGRAIYVQTDFSDQEIKRVPVYYIKQLDELRDLSTDATRAMCNYISMAVNFSEMGKLADAMRLLQQHVREDYEVVQHRGARPIRDMFRADRRQYNAPLTKTGEGTRAAKRILDYIDRNFWNETKNEIGEVRDPLRRGKTISLDAIFNAFMKLVSVSRMGLNPLSGMTNYLQGESQMLIEARTGRYFDMKDMAWMKKEYNFLLLPYMGAFNSADRHDRLYLLINQFNAMEDFFRDMRDKDFNKSAYKRVLGQGNIYFMNTMGEHYLHAGGMLAILKHEKVHRVSDPEGKVVSLYDTIVSVHDKDGWHLELDDDIEFVDKNRSFLQGNGLFDKQIIKRSDRDALFENLAVYINRINDGMHGGYSEAEKGNINQKALGRAVLQFRQWMFGMYAKLYSKDYYDAVLGTASVGSYRSAWRLGWHWILGMIHDMKNMSLKMALENNKLNQKEKENAQVAFAQAGLYLGLAIAVMLTAGWKDEDDRAKRLIAYNLRRLKLETGALSIVDPIAFAKNILTLVQSPAAGVKTIENLTQVFDLMSAVSFENGRLQPALVKSGRYKGWWKPMKAVWTTTPLYNIQKLIDMDDYSYMFNIFN